MENKIKKSYHIFMHYYKHLFTLCLSLMVGLSSFAQQATVIKDPVIEETISEKLPDIDYSFPKTYTIADIAVTGAEGYDDFVLIGASGLQVGQKITIPGSDITDVINRYLEKRIFSDVGIEWTKVKNDSVWLKIHLKLLPRVSVINFKGLKKSEIEDLDNKIGLLKDKQITPNMSDRAKLEIKRYLDEKGFANAEIELLQKDDPAKQGYVVVDVNVDKKEKTKVHKIYVIGNDNVTALDIDKAMKNTNDNKIQNIFRSKKFVKDLYEKDKASVIELYNERGYRDAYIISDSIAQYKDKYVDIYLKIHEGKKYYFGDLNWVGNTVYPYQYMNGVLGIKRGDLYNHKQLMDRLIREDDAVAKLYQNRGYLFSEIIPIETSIDNDTIDFELRVVEKNPATINKVNIIGNTRVYENVIRRELYTKPGKLYSQSDIMRSIQYLAQMNHFNNEQLYQAISDGGIQPNPESGTVDINYKLVTKSSDQVQFSAGWGGAGLVASAGFKFTNFAIQNLFDPNSYHHLVPQGEGQIFDINFQTNGRYYSTFSLSFLEPWLGGKRPNSLSVSAFYSSQSGMSERFLNNSRYYNPYNSGYGGYGYGGYGRNQYLQNSMGYEYDKNKYMRTLGLTVGYGKRLKWPDSYFTFHGQVSFQRYMLSNWIYADIPDGSYNDFSIDLSIGRNSIDDPIFTRSGSTFSFGLQFTPPYSMFTGKDYSKLPYAEKYRWLEYHKWKFSAKSFTSLMPSTRKTPVIMTRAEFSYIGQYNKNVRSPFGSFQFGGDGMTGYNYGVYANEYIPMRGYETGALTSYSYDDRGRITGQQAYLYNKFTLELRFPISLEQNATIWALGFVEAGNSFYKISDYNPFDLKRSAGVGVRLFLPMFGMMGIDWGYGFDNPVKGTKPNGGKFHFVIGKEL